MRRGLIVLVAVLGLAVAVLVRAPAPTVSAQTAIGSVIVEGTGNGHGRGMSQWGAYGWAVDFGWNWEQILDYYYGNTTLADVDTLATIDVQLKALDGVATLGVVSYVNDVRWAGNVAPTMYATEVGPNAFDVWTASAPTCSPIGTPDVVWTKLTAVPVAGPIEFTTDNGPVNANRMTTGAATSALGVCDPAGKVTHYRGSVRMEDGDGVVNRVVNRVLVEDYLRGVVPREISASWADAGGGRGVHAVMAQAVAARSYALQPGRWTGGICDTQACQVYFGAASRASVGLAAVAVEDPRSDTAIALTVGKVRVWAPGGLGAVGSIVSTEFSGSNGPRTAGWPFPVRDDPADGTPLNRNHRWARVLDGDALAVQHGLGVLTSVSMVEGDPRYDGIWYNDVVLTGTTGSVRIPAWTFRNQNGLPSPGFTLRGEPRGARPIAMNQRIELQVVGASVSAPDGTQRVVPAGVSAVALNITAVSPSAAGYATVWPCDVARPDASNLNFLAGGVVANGVIAPVGASGRVCFFSNATTHFLVDIAGWFAGGTTSPAFVGTTPSRVVDTRHAIGPSVRVRPGATIAVPMAGAAMRRTDGSPVTIPTDATAVAVNVTAVQPSNPGFFTVWPCGASKPEASNVNFTRGGAVANGVVAPLGAGGAICIYSDQAADVLVDVLGWFGGGASPAFVGGVPRRLVDTRNAIGGPAAVFTPSASRAVPVRGVTLDVNGVQRQVPVDASAVALNVTMVEAREAGFATVWPCGTPQPDASNVNFARGATVANGVVAPIGPDGSVCVATSASAHLLVDIAGWFAGGDAGFVGNVPRRLVDTRNSIGPAPQ